MYGMISCISMTSIIENPWITSSTRTCPKVGEIVVAGACFGFAFIYDVPVFVGIRGLP
mgnify:CR=1 FL=1